MSRRRDADEEDELLETARDLRDALRGGELNDALELCRDLERDIVARLEENATDSEDE